MRSDENVTKDSDHLKSPTISEPVREVYGIFRRLYVPVTLLIKSMENAKSLSMRASHKFCTSLILYYLS